MENRRTYYYARVSTKEQNLDRQITSFKDMGANERDIITNKVHKSDNVFFCIIVINKSNISFSVG